MVSTVRVVPVWVTVTVKLVAPASSFTLLGATLSRMSISSIVPGGLEGDKIKASSSLMVVVTEDVPRVGVDPPPPVGLEMEAVKSSEFSARMSSMVCTVKVLSPASVWVKVRVPEVSV